MPAPDTIEDRYGPQTPSQQQSGTTTQPQGQPPYYGPAYTPKTTTPATSGAPVDHTWDGVPSGYKTELEDLALQWQQIAGFAVTITEATLKAMADAHVVSLRDMGQWLWGNTGWQGLLKNMPWLSVGMDQTSWNRTIGDYQDALERYTGQRPDFQKGAGGTDFFTNMMWDAIQSGESQAGFQEKLLHDESVRNQYGWIKFGLTFDDFQQKKTDFSLSFGQQLDNNQAILQLQYLHQAQGQSRSVEAPAPQGQQQGPTTPSEVMVR